MKKKFLAIVLCLACVTLISCSKAPDIESPNLTSDRKPDKIIKDTDAPADFTEADDIAVTDFGIRLFQQAVTDSNLLVSPLSVISALSMTANGAREETLTQMETVLGMPVDRLNAYLNSYTAALPCADDYTLHLANSIWLKDEPEADVNQDFLQTVTDWYDADIYETSFDNSTVKDINNWVNQNTDGMIPKILDAIPKDGFMYLVNALSFDAKWQEEYKSHQVHNRDFTGEDGTVQTVKFMYGSEQNYLEDENTTGFIKYYKDRKYAFAALLPKEGIHLKDYTDSLTGEKFRNLLTHKSEAMVETAIPKFKNASDMTLNELLIAMGMTDAFDRENADFTGIKTFVDGNLYISRVLHNTYIAVDELGTKAAAATAVEMQTESAMELPDDVKFVYLDRPFVYAIIDCEKNLPIFIGTVMNVAFYDEALSLFPVSP